MLLHVSVPLHHLQGALILCLLKLQNIKMIKLRKTADRCVVKCVLLINCGSGCIKGKGSHVAGRKGLSSTLVLDGGVDV